jgi:hypothetical protein
MTTRLPTRLRFAAAVDLCMRVLLALLALGVITKTVSSPKATAADVSSRGMGNVVLVHGAPQALHGAINEPNERPITTIKAKRALKAIDAPGMHTGLRQRQRQSALERPDHGRQ